MKKWDKNGSCWKCCMVDGKQGAHKNYILVFSKNKVPQKKEEII